MSPITDAVGTPYSALSSRAATARRSIFSAGDPPGSDRFVCESCLGIHPKSEHRLAPAKHFSRWRSGELLREANVCKDCFAFVSDPRRAGIVRRVR